MATTTDTAIFELKFKDDSGKTFDAWDKRLEDLEGNFKKTFKNIGKTLGNVDFSGFGGVFGVVSKTITSTLIPGINLLKNAFSALVIPLKTTANLIKEGFIKGLETMQDVLVSSVKNFSKFEDSFVVAQRTIGRTRERTKEWFDTLADGIRTLSAVELKGGVASKTLADIASIGGTLGIKTKKDLEAFTETIAKMTVATDLTAEAAARALPKLLNAWDLPIAANIEGLGSVINQLGNDFNATQSEIVDSMLRMQQASSAFKLTIDQAAALSATMIDAGLRTRLSATAMSNVMRELTADHTKFAEVLSINSAQLKQAILSNDPTDALRLVFEAFQKITTATPDGKIKASQALKELGFTGQGVSETFLAMAKNMGTLDEALKTASEEMINQESLSKEYDIAMQTLTNAWQAFQNILIAITEFIGKPLSEALARLLNDKITPILIKLFEWITTNESLKKSWEGLITEIETEIGEIIDNFELWRKSLIGNEDVLKSIESIWISLGSIFDSIVLKIGSFGAAISSAGKKLSPIESAILRIDQALAMFLFNLETQGPWEAFKELALTAWEAIKNAAKTAWDFIKTEFNAAVSDADENTKKWIARFKNLPQTFDDMIVDVKTFIAVVKLLADEWSGVITVLRTAAKIVKELTFDARRDDPVMQRLQNIDKENQKIKQSTKEVTQAVGDMKDAYNSANDDITIHSVLPDIDTWTKKVTQSIGIMNNAVDQTQQAYSSVGRTASQMTNVNLEGITKRIEEVQSYLQHGASFGTAQSLTQASRELATLGGNQFQAQIAAYQAQKKVQPIQPASVNSQTITSTPYVQQPVGSSRMQPMTLQANILLDDMVIGKVAQRFTQEQKTQAGRITIG